mgnify:CR=1 FL=1
MEPYDMVCLSNDFDYFCFPCGTLKLRNEPKPLFNPTIEISKSKNLGLRKNVHFVKSTSKLKPTQPVYKPLRVNLRGFSALPYTQGKG